MKKIYIIMGVCLGLAFTSCKEDKLSEADSWIPTGEAPKNELDKWIYNEFTEPYNINVIYKYIDGEADVSKNLIPPRESQVRPFMEMIRTAWIEPYIEEAGEEFFRTYAPKQFQLLGSASWNQGSITQGTAEGGRKIVLYQVNDYNHSNLAQIKRYIHVIHHEFAHILQQNINEDVSYKEITPGYVADWTGYSDREAREQGFITNYAMSSYKEDFVEMLAIILTNTPEQYEAIISSIKSTEGKDKLREKEAIVRNYFLQSWGIDLASFQELTIAAMNKVVNGEN